MKEENDQQRNINYITLDKLTELNCYKQLDSLRKILNQKFKLTKNDQVYIRLPNTHINSVIFFLLGKVQFIRDQEAKFKGKKIQFLKRQHVEHALRKINQQKQPKKDTRLCQQIIKHKATIEGNQGVIEADLKVWDKIVPQLIPQKYPQISFKLDSFDNSQNQKSLLVVQFQETQDTCVLCFFETQKHFTIQQSDKLLVQAKNLTKKAVITYVDLKKDDRELRTAVIFLIILTLLSLQIWLQLDYHQRIISPSEDLKNYQVSSYQAKTLQISRNINSFINPWKQHVKEIKELIQKNIQPYLDSIYGFLHQIFNHPQVKKVTVIVANNSLNFLKFIKGIPDKWIFGQKKI